MASSASNHLRPSCLFPDEAEIARLVLGPKRAKDWKSLALVLERRGLPMIDPMFGGRFWPAVLAYFLRMYGLEAAVRSHYAPDGPENWDAL